MRVLLLLLYAALAAAHQCISIYGLETPAKDFVCSWVHPVDHYVKELKGLGFDTLRIPFSYEYVQQGDFSRLDEIMNRALERNMSVILDLHRIWNSHQGPTPEEGVSLDQITQTWLSVLWRYEHYPNLVAHNAFNEYTGTDIAYLTRYHKLIFNAIENAFPHRFVHIACGYLWSGDMHGFTLEDLPYHDRILYSVHKFVFSGTADETDWEASFGNEFSPDKIVVGEWGWKQQDAEWATRFIAYLRKKHISNTCFWTVAHSGDTDGIYHDDCTTLDVDKYNLLRTLWAADGGGLRGSYGGVG